MQPSTLHSRARSLVAATIISTLSVSSRSYDRKRLVNDYGIAMK